jgi:hypothetical protein
MCACDIITGLTTAVAGDQVVVGALAAAIRTAAAVAIPMAAVVAIRMAVAVDAAAA